MPFFFSFSINTTRGLFNFSIEALKVDSGIFLLSKSYSQGFDFKITEKKRLRFME